MDTSVLEPAGRRRRRKHSAEFKAELIRACQQPGVSSAAIALANGLNANMLRRWVNCAEQPESAAAPARPPPPPEFVPLKLPAPQLQTDIRIELQRYKVMLMTGRKDEATFRFYEAAGFNRDDKQAFIAKAPRA
ncbi:transposase [Variovorax sp. J22G73]|uniref:transposase n=1 Tax=unclassified Variovorax TaxID=663243 RepID=UPI002578F3A8|nr:MULTISPECIES: transposase [unclassified Variovorax]MDM0009985.1 transposase [Variovorax sp. J22R203]MDM0102493.1 transposase [Variovorax sp. J22G73]